MVLTFTNYRSVEILFQGTLLANQTIITLFKFIITSLLPVVTAIHFLQLRINISIILSLSSIVLHVITVITPLFLVVTVIIDHY